MDCIIYVKSGCFRELRIETCFGLKKKAFSFESNRDVDRYYEDDFE
jgi:hypothetical protein